MLRDASLSPTPGARLAALADLLAARREAILLAWRKVDRADPEQSTGHSLTFGQFLDHMPAILDTYERNLRSRPGGAAALAADAEAEEVGVKHGLHRWQQGYRLNELISECGHFQTCVFEELESIVAGRPELERATLREAHRRLLHLINDVIGESAAQYERMQQAEARGRLRDLTRALEHVDEIERRRTTLLHQAVHDLNSDVLGVRMATTMLGELMDLARLEAGREKRAIAGFDAGTLMTGLCDRYQPFAREGDLFLEAKGPVRLPVECDEERVRRVAKHLLVNAIQHTESGGVIVSWGEEKENWWLRVEDTGTGMLTEAGTSMADGLQEATASAKEADENAAALLGEASHVLPPMDTATPAPPSPYQPGEGIGLSIVKRLCEMLDASLEIASSAEAGTTLRVVFPCRYGRQS
jgi:signal transduction histidine kinase